MLRDQIIVGAAFLVPVSLLVAVALSLMAERRDRLRAVNAAHVARVGMAGERERDRSAVASQNAA